MTAPNYSVTKSHLCTVFLVASTATFSLICPQLPFTLSSLLEVNMPPTRLQLLCSYHYSHPSFRSFLHVPKVKFLFARLFYVCFCINYFLYIEKRSYDISEGMLELTIRVMCLVIKNCIFKNYPCPSREGTTAFYILLSFLVVLSTRALPQHRPIP